MVLRVHTHTISRMPNAAMASRPKFGLSTNTFPITKKLWPKAENLFYLAASTILARFVTGVIRVFVDATDDNPKKTKIERANSTWERLFIEIFGTLGNVFTLHFGQDLAAKFIERTRKHDPAKLLEILKANAPQETWESLTKAVKASFGENSTGIISRVLYGKANLYHFEKALNQPALVATLKDPLHTFAKRLNHGASIALLAGICLSAAFGGVVVQLVNDYIFSQVEPYLNRLIGLRDNRLFKHKVDVPPGAHDLPLAQRTFRS